MKKLFTKFLVILTLSLFSAVRFSYGQAAVGMPFGFTNSGANTYTAFTTSVIVNAVGTDNSTAILTPTGFNFTFADVTYQNILLSTNGWAVLIPSSTVTLATSTTISAALATNQNVLPVASTAGISVGMYVGGPGILGAAGGNGLAQVTAVGVGTVTININTSAALAIGSALNFYNFSAAATYATALPGNGLSTYAGGYPLVASLWDDLATSAFSFSLGATTSIRWTSKWDKANAATIQHGISFNNTNNIVIFYPTLAAYTPTTPSASIGIAGVCTGDFYSMTPTAATTATVDSLVENSTYTGAVRPSNAMFTFNPYCPNDVCTGTRPAKDLGTINATCTFNTYSIVNATNGAAFPCASDLRDVWFKFTKPAGVTSVTITTKGTGGCQSATGTTVEAFLTCGGASLGCATTSVTYPSFGELSLSRPCASEVIYVRVTADGDQSPTGKFQLCVKSSTTLAGGTTCSAPTFICSLPYNQTGLTTAGSVNNYDSTTAVCHTLSMAGEDYVFSYTPSVSQCVRISITSPDVNPSVFIFNNCPDSSGGTTYCLGSAEVPTGTATINSVTLTGGVTYYIVVDNGQVGGNINFDINITTVGTANSYDNCATYASLGTVGSGVSCVYQTYSTECSTPSAAGTVPLPSCVPGSIPAAFIDGVTGDVWLAFTSTFIGSLLINTAPSAVNPSANIAMAIYTGSCGAFSLYACDYNSGPNGYAALSIPVTSGTSYYIRVWSENPESQGNFDICFQSACAPPNDLPCAAVYLPLGGTATGFNTCSGSLAEPPNTAQCVAGGTINTVWYKCVVPASGQIHIRTHPLTLTDTQIQAFTFASGCSNAATTYVSRGCNDDGTPCSGGFSDFSDLTCTGLTPGDTLFIAVDGFNSLTGSFEITVIDGTTTTFPPVNQQDCAGAQVLCSTSSVVVADPGFRNNGNICDLPSGAGTCWGTGERNSVWYQFTVDPALAGGTATLAFDVLTAASTDIDVLVWDITGQANPCAAIQSATLAPAGCNYAAANASTGLTTTSPLPYAYSNAITFTGAPRTYLLLLNNWNSSINAGFTINWNSTPISTAASTSIWNGGTVAADTNYTCSTCWGSCGSTPACGIDAIVNTTLSGRQPCVVGAQSVKNITINAGATLRIKTGASLAVCGNFTNYGTLICEPGSTVQFIGNTAQTITGALTGANAFANLSITKGGGSVTLANDIDVTQNFTTSSATSIFNINGKYMKVAGNFTNFSGTTTFTGYGGSTVEFNGTTAQTFTNSNGSIILNRVRMNKASGNLYLSGANSTMNIDTALVLTSGLINTRAIAALEVNVKYNNVAAVSGHSAISYIDGKLRRAVYSGSPLTLPMSIDFPVGDTLTPGGYALANITFTSGTTINNLLSYFSPWPTPATPPGVGPTASECMIATYDVLPLFNDGYWTFTKGNASFNGAYKVTLFDVGKTNLIGTGFTVAKADQAANPALSASWGLIGQCVISSTHTNTQRVNINSTYTATMTTTLGSNVITTANTTALSVGSPISGTGIPVGSVITAILNSGAFTISNNATASGTITGTFGSTASAGTSFNHLYSVAQSTVPLPIKLLSFDAELRGEKVLCTWVTASETNNDHFDVERSFDGESFVKIGQVNGFGAGISTTNRSYSFEDPNQCSELRYYRLRQVDIDGRFEYSETVAINCSKKDPVIQIHPNPVSDELNYQFIQANDDVLSVRILDVTGRVVKEEITNAVHGFNSSSLDVSKLATGSYYLQLRSTTSDSTDTPRQIQFLKQ